VRAGGDFASGSDLVNALIGVGNRPFDGCPGIQKLIERRFSTGLRWSLLAPVDSSSLRVAFAAPGWCELRPEACVRRKAAVKPGQVRSGGGTSPADGTRAPTRRCNHARTGCVALGECGFG